MAGANVLAAMCASIVNLLPPGAGLVSGTGARLAVGVNFLAAGGLTRSLVDERALDPIATLQANLADHLAVAERYEEGLIASMTEDLKRRTRPAPPTGMPKLLSLRDDIEGNSAPIGDWAFHDLLSPCCDRGLESITASPAIFVESSELADLEQKLRSGHLNRPYVRVTLVDADSTTGLSQRVLALMRGTGRVDRSGVPTVIRGRVAASCSMSNLKLGMLHGEDGLISNLLWLVDGGPRLDPTGTVPEVVVPYNVHDEYARALAIAWRCRLDYRQAQSPTIRHDWEPRQREWLAYLNKLEPECPGLTLAARPLFGTLIFGLARMSSALNGEKARWSAAGVLGLAKLLVDRMVQCRQRFAQTEKDVACRDLAVKLVPKLVEGPLDAREIVRKTSRLRIGECRDALDVLNRHGLIRQVEGGKWELALPAPQAVAKLRTPYIDV